MCGRSAASSRSAALASELVEAGHAEGSGKAGEVGRLTKTVLEAALKAQITEHQGYDGHDAAGRRRGSLP